MSTSDDIEAAMWQLIADDKAKKRAEQEEWNRRFAKSAELARGFVDLMGKHHIDPEPIYTYEQARGEKPNTSVESFTRVAWGWVIYYSLDEGLPDSVTCLQRDGKVVRNCSLRLPGSSRSPAQGLVERPKRRVLKGKRVLYVDRYEVEKPYESQEYFARAAKLYFT